MTDKEKEKITGKINTVKRKETWQRGKCCDRKGQWISRSLLVCAEMTSVFFSLQ